MLAIIWSDLAHWFNNIAYRHILITTLPILVLVSLGQFRPEICGVIYGITIPLVGVFGGMNQSRHSSQYAWAHQAALSPYQIIWGKTIATLLSSLLTLLPGLLITSRLMQLLWEFPFSAWLVFLVSATFQLWFYQTSGIIMQDNESTLVYSILIGWQICLLLLTPFRGFSLVWYGFQWEYWGMASSWTYWLTYCGLTLALTFFWQKRDFCSGRDLNV